MDLFQMEKILISSYRNILYILITLSKINSHNYGMPKVVRPLYFYHKAKFQ